MSQFHPSALVLGASRRAGLAIIRSLGRQGIRVTAADSELLSPGFFSKFTSSAFRYPPPQSDSDAFCEFLLKEVRASSFDVLFPVHDFDLLPISRKRSLFEPFVKLVLPPQQALDIAADKLNTVELARSLAIPAPETYAVEDADELESLGTRIEYPAVVKPRSQVQWKGKAASLSLVRAENYVNSPKELVRVYEKINEVSPHPIIQRQVRGTGAGVAALFNRGEPRVLFSYRRMREYPPSGGPSTLRESTDEPVLKRHAESLLRELKWHGVAMVEFKVEAKTGRPWLVEINGRFWGSVALPIAAGADFPHLLYRLAMEGDIPRISGYVVGVRARWLVPGDILWFLSELRNGRGRRGAVMREFFRPAGVHYDYESRTDPLPAFGAIIRGMADGMEVLRGHRSLAGEYLRGV